MQQETIQLKTEVLQLSRILAKPSHDRMPFEGLEMAKSLQKINVLNQIFDLKSQEFITMCITQASLISLESGVNVYSEIQLQPVKSNKITDNKEVQKVDENKLTDEKTGKKQFLYVVLEGSVRIYLTDQQTSQESFGQLDINKSTHMDIYAPSLHQLKQFHIFGLTQLLYSLPTRHQDVTTTKPTKLMILPLCELKSLLNKQFLSHLEKAYQYLEKNTYFQSLNRFQKQQLAIWCKQVKLKPEQQVYEEGLMLDGVIFIVYGRLRVVKRMKTSERKDIKLRPYVIDEIEEMKSIGEYECVNRKRLSYSLWSAPEQTGCFYKLNYKQLSLISHGVLKLFREHAVPYPDDEQMDFLHNIKNQISSAQRKVQKRFVF